MAKAKIAPKRCRAETVIGVQLPWRKDSGRYHVCLTPGQWRTLFPRGAGKKLGCGSFACVWERGAADAVVKITRDRDDAANLLAAQDHPRIVKVLEAYELEKSGTSLEESSRGKPVPVYALVVERIQPFPREAHEILRRLPAARMEREYFTRKVPRREFSVSADLRRQVDAACSTVRPVRACRSLLHGIVDTYEDLAHQGIVWLDIHPGNFGVDAKGRWKIVDLGNTLVPVQRPRVTPLRGLRYRRRRR